MAIDIVFDNLRRYIDETEVQERVLDSVVSTCLLDSLTTVGMAELAREGEAANMSWSLDKEPEPCTCDTWARGSLQVKQRVAMAEAMVVRQTSQSLTSKSTTVKKARGPGKSPIP